MQMNLAILSAAIKVLVQQEYDMITLFWNKNVNKFVNLYTGENVRAFTTFEGSELEWYETLAEVLVSLKEKLTKEFKYTCDVVVHSTIFDMLKSTVLFKAQNSSSGTLFGMNVRSSDTHDENVITMSLNDGQTKLGYVRILND